MEEVQHAGAVAALCLALSDDAPQQIKLVHQLCVLVQQQVMGQRVGSLVVLGDEVVAAQRHLRLAVVGLFLQDALVNLVSLVELSVGAQHVGIEPQVVQVVGILVGQRLHLLDGRRHVVHIHVERALQGRQALALAVVHLHAVEHGYGLLVLLLVAVQPVEHVEQVVAVLVGLEQLLNHGHSLVVLLLRDVGVGQRLHVGGVVWAQLGRFLQIRQRFLLLLHLRIVLGEEVVGLAGLRVQLHASRQEVEGGIVVVLLPLHHRLEEQHVVASGVRQLLMYGRLRHTRRLGRCRQATAAAHDD